MSYLLDTNTVIHFLDASLPLTGMQMLNTVVDREPIISIVTKMETLGFNFPSQEEQDTMETFVHASLVLGVDEAVVKRTISIRKMKKIKLPDAIIAATALVYDLTLVTRNTKDFVDIPNLIIIDPGNW